MYRFEAWIASRKQVTEAIDGLTEVILRSRDVKAKAVVFTHVRQMYLESHSAS